MDIDWEEYSLLLLCVHPALIEALPEINKHQQLSPYARDAVPISQTELTLSSHTTNLRVDVQAIGLNFTRKEASGASPLASSPHARLALHKLLEQFEEVVLDRIKDTLNVIIDRLKDKIAYTHFPKLVLLCHALTESLLPQHAAQHAAQSIDFGKETTRYRLISLVSQSFTQEISRASPRHSKPLPQQSLHSGRPKELEQSKRVARAVDLSKKWRQLFMVISECGCHNQELARRAYLRVSNFDQPELDMLMSECSAEECLKQTYFKLSDGNDRTQPVQCVCTELKRAKHWSLPSRFRVESNGVDMHLYKAPRERRGTRPFPMESTLSEVLRTEQRRERKAGWRTISLNKKRYLAVKITEALVHLYGSPLNWDVDSIYVTEVQSKSGLEAWLSVRLGRDRSALINRQPQLLKGAVSLLALTATLLELVLEEGVHVGDEDLEEGSNEPSLYMALIRYLDYLPDNCNDGFDEVIDKCIRVYDDFEHLSEEDEGNEKIYADIQKRLYEDVLVPLENIYSTFKNPKEVAIPQAPVKVLIERSEGQQSTTDQVTRFHATPGPSMQNLGVIEETLEGEPFILSQDHSREVIRAQLLANGIEDSWTWFERVDRVSSQMEEMCPEPLARDPVRIAILDTGCDLDSECIINLPDGERRLGHHWHDWAGNSTEHIDEDDGKHGTKVVATLLRVASQAQVFVARIAKNRKALQGAEAAIVKAIDHAVHEWNVDIISMSFGFASDTHDLDNAIYDAIHHRRKKKRGILFLAAANNEGLNSDELSPAKHSNVISVRGTDSSGGFITKFNPEPCAPSQSLLFGTLAVDVPYDCADRMAKASGCSFATPILAGFIATLIQYIDWTCDEPLRARIRSRDGIERLLASIAPSGKRRYVALWKFFDLDESKRKAVITLAL